MRMTVAEELLFNTPKLCVTLQFDYDETFVETLKGGMALLRRDTGKSIGDVLVRSSGRLAKAEVDARHR